MESKQVNNLTSINYITSYDYSEVYDIITKVVEFNIGVHSKIHDDKKDSYFSGVLHRKHCSKYDPRLVFYKDLFIYNKEFYFKYGDSVYKFNEYSYEPIVKIIRVIYKDINTYDDITQDEIQGPLFGNHISIRFVNGFIILNWFYNNGSELVRLDNTIKAKKIFYNDRNEYIKCVQEYNVNYLTYPFKNLCT